ncbi:hypothetical protein MK280_17135, partial [Myxococcota bacterium]|nr:hypothetical protein [Myxococcota bacterium]
MRTVNRYRSIAGLSFLIAWLIGCADTGSVEREPTPAELRAEIIAAFSEARPVPRFQRLAAVMEHLSPENIDTVSEVYEEYAEGLRQLEMRPFYDAWTRFDGLSAYEFAASVPFKVQGDIAREAVVTAWTVNDFISARVVIEEDL